MPLRLSLLMTETSSFLSLGLLKTEKIRSAEAAVAGGHQISQSMSFFSRVVVMLML
jgi:hypothetical protein